ncbi:hypothetical protein A2837_02370 [Candidatus Kaiserbacteria bacterium RIFCSPHIGHO2_01_FULL_46_22]|uniref:SHS2 domain-containing protein n=1 Tax=Candidatus Kaiserbacteria bacterium RIFCSPHIGHO2_01_FULL_46_22 TaxID=1798475 RepID=A0A1F6BWZ3_9BACT|nr:MAG: hypothetical protein A2837_02370 [Candidatus Kaiserbacteria bacterium RIFCSPHIGHO2_01_FULL_46_22]
MAFSFKKIFSGLSETTPARSSMAVGIDIGGSSVKVVELEDIERAVALRTYGELQLGPYEGKPLGEIITLTEQHRVEAVTDVLREAGVKGRSGALAMPLSSSFVTVITLPVMQNTTDSLAARVPVEARKYVPLPLSEVTLDWTEIPAPPTANNMHEIMLAAVENNALEEYRSLLMNIGMTSQPAEIEVFSLIRSTWRQSDTTLAIIDIGARGAKLYLVRQGNLERLHRVGQGGQEITKRVSQTLGIPFEAAEDIKRSYDRAEEKGAEIYKVTTTVLESPLSEFRRLIEQYEARSNTPLGRIVLGGGVFAGPYMLEFAQDRLGRPVELANPFSKVAYPAFLEDTLRQIGPSFGVALGAALRAFQ